MEGVKMIMKKEKKKSGKGRKIVIGAIVIFVLFIIICCLAGGDDSGETMENSSPAGDAGEVKELIEGYCEAIKGFDLDNTDKYLASEPDYWVNMNENALNTFMDIFKDGASGIEYTIEDIKVDEEQEIFSWADATVRFRFLDYSKLMSDSLVRLENEYGTGAISSDSSDEEIYRRLYEIFVEEQKAADETWSDIVVDFSLAKNRNKSNPAWHIDPLPEEIPVILTCNTESSFEKCGGVSDESGMEPEGYEEHTAEANGTYGARDYMLGTYKYVSDNGASIVITVDDDSYYGEDGSLVTYYKRPYAKFHYGLTKDPDNDFERGRLFSWSDDGNTLGFAYDDLVADSLERKK